MHPVAQVELHEHVAEMRLHRRAAHVERFGDLGVRQSPGDELEHLTLASGEDVEPGGAVRLQGAAGEVLDEAAGHRRCEQGLPARDHPDAASELVAGDVLQQEATGSRAQRFVHVLVEVEGRKHQHLHRVARVGARQPARRLDPVHHRHTDVHEHDVGLQGVSLRDGHLAVLGLAHHLDVVVGVEDHAEAGAHEGLVVDDEDADAHRGRRALTANPPPGRLPAVSSPPRRSTRSRMPTSPWPPLVRVAPHPSSRISRSS